MPLFEIKHRWTGTILFSIEIGSLRMAVEAAVRSKADLSRADLSWANLHIPIVEQLDAKILSAIEAGGTLAMDTWHQCQTTHCRAGWAIHLAGEAGSALEELVGPCAAGGLIYQASAGYVPDFYATNEEALEDLQAHVSKSAP